MTNTNGLNASAFAIGCSSSPSVKAFISGTWCRLQRRLLCAGRSRRSETTESGAAQFDRGACLEQDGLAGITSTTDLSESGLEKALTGAHEASRFGNPDDVPGFSPLATAPLPALDRPLKQRQGILPLLSTLRDAEADLLARHPAIQSVPYNGLAESLSQSLYLNSDGALRRDAAHPGFALPLCEGGETGRKPRSSGAVRLALGSEELDVSGCIEEAVERTVSHLAYRPIDTGTYRICFTPEAFLSLLGAFSSMLNARSVLDGVSLSQRESLGTTVAVPSSHSTTTDCTAATSEHRRSMEKEADTANQPDRRWGAEELPALGGNGPSLRSCSDRSCRPWCESLGRSGLVCGEQNRGGQQRS